MDSHHAKVLILGSGAAGLTSAIYTARAGLEPTLVHGMQPGGQMTITTDVENYPGFADVIQGPWLMEQMQAQAENVGTNMIADLITEADLSSAPFRLKGDSGDEYTADALIICTGAEARWLGLASEQTYQGFGVSACATCDGFFYRGLEVAVIGGGNTAVEEALYLTNHADKVTLIHRRDELRAEKMLQTRLLGHDKVEVMWDSVLDEVLGKTEGPMPEVTGIKVRNVKTDGVTELDLSGVFVAIGHTPNTDLFKGQLDLDDEGYLITNPDSTGTKIPGVFAAGDVQDNKFRQAVTAAGTGCMAALEVEKYLAAKEAGELEAAE
ncbi:MAG: thioredoxin-disulfide reductase [Rhodospirillaceae bacterium]|mgnify:FL=1|jgi:thioredoxin reductase (NADPH)|nr:thioredoxin-disulfide reductase [Rhodospirillaceae bacterium]MBT4117673.1 thioredoxin-disulfide reductase [Rhodospirillaceae bacterium]MBT4674585.1 thioredoxin-disulfide reductase [Rhodospirillaceae bacterium]MBT4719236.1 thioredoxin-disulfide reductase [Rhodospirillaceae bacterium]MBT4750248.1 thioredoxin-disulfide reductase [Rhodospirillaceae bacterium]